MPHPEDRPIISTADDAILAKLATVKAGYYEDPYLEPFRRHAAGISEQDSHTRSRRQVQPIIKRGTHARVSCMDRAVSSFLQYKPETSKLQIVVLGSGKDTAYFRHCQQENNAQWYEVDHASVIQNKSAIVQETPDIFQNTSVQKLPHGFILKTSNRKTNNGDTPTENTIKTCHLVEHDLRKPSETLIQKLQQTDGFDDQAPTLFLLECVLMYIPVDASHDILQTITKHFPKAYLCCYEPILGSDAFGNVMEQNLVHAGVAVTNSCLLKTRTLEAQLDKVITCGFQMAIGCDMYSAYETVMTAEQRRRANQCEFLDEVEEWMLIMRHYCFLVATTTPSDDFSKIFCGVGPKSALGFLQGKCVEKTVSSSC